MAGHPAIGVPVAVAAGPEREPEEDQPPGRALWFVASQPHIDGGEAGQGDELVEEMCKIRPGRRGEVGADKGTSESGIRGRERESACDHAVPQAAERRDDSFRITASMPWASIGFMKRKPWPSWQPI